MKYKDILAKKEQERAQDAPDPSPQDTPAKPSRRRSKRLEGLPADTPAPPVSEAGSAPPAALQAGATPAAQAALNEAYALPYDPPSYHFDDSDDPLREFAARELCRRKLLPFIQRFRPKYDAAWVHEDICRRLERFVKQVEAGECPRLLLMMPVRHGKSEICSRHFPAWVLGQHPDWEIIAASGAQSLAMSFSRYGRDLMSDPAYNTVFPEAQLSPTSKSVENWALTKGGGYLSAGIGTMITGRGAHVLVIDDPVRDGEAADSPTIRENVWEWYMSTAYTRLAPGGGVLGVLTWWNEDDWAGRIQLGAQVGGDVFEIVKYPAVNDHGDEYLLPDDTIHQFSENDEPPPQGSTLLRRQGSALHPARIPLKELMGKKANYIAQGQKRWWDALFQQNPTPEDGDYFTPAMFQYYSSPPPRSELYVYQAWDFAISTDQRNDYTVGTTVGVDFRGAVYVLDVRRFKSSDGIHIANTIVDYAREYDPTLIGVEDGQIWRALESQFARSCEEARVYPSYEVMKPLTDKLVRASPLRGQMQAGKVFFDKGAHWFDALYKEFLRFGAGGVHDDIVDSASWAIRLTLTRSAPRDSRREPKLKSWRDKLPGLMGDKGVSHMAA